MRQIIALFLFLIMSSQPVFAVVDSYEILKKCDQSRGNLEGVIWTVTVEAEEKGERRARVIQVKSRGFDVVAETLSPAIRKGYQLLMINGNMWFYKPGLSKAVPVSKRQKLVGQAVNGDIASTNYAEDYRVVSRAETSLDGRPCYLFELEARTGKTTYSFIKYWVLQGEHVGVKAEFYSSGGKKLVKSANISYDHTVRLGNEKRPFISDMKIKDQLMSRDKTHLKFSEPQIGAIPERAFNLNLLRP